MVMQRMGDYRSLEVRGKFSGYGTRQLESVVHLRALDDRHMTCGTCHFGLPSMIGVCRRNSLHKPEEKKYYKL